MAGSLPVLSAWFLKAPEKHGKSQRRFFELHFLPLSAEVRYFTDIKFDGQARVPRGKSQKGAVPIGKHSVILFNSDDPSLAICNPRRTWRLTAESNEDAQKWGKLLHKVVYDCKAMESGKDDPGTRFVHAIEAPESEAPPPPSADAPSPPSQDALSAPSTPTAPSTTAPSPPAPTDAAPPPPPPSETAPAVPAPSLVEGAKQGGSTNEAPSGGDAPVASAETAGEITVTETPTEGQVITISV
eukprot:m.448475 g.448475  ORF g.448475 m.448475 type:complete len:242 (+) comp19667_c0_seq1:58-783(+)